MNLSADSGRDYENIRKRRSDYALPSIASGQLVEQHHESSAGAIEFTLKVKRGPDSCEKDTTTQGNEMMSPNCISPRFVFIETMDDEENQRSEKN